MSLVPDVDDAAKEGDHAHRAVDLATSALIAVAAIGVLVVVFRVDYFPTLDGPHHLFLGHLENHFDDRGSGFPNWIERGTPFTSMGFHFVFSTFERVFAWRRAFQITLAILALGWGAGHVLLARAIHPRRTALGLVGVATSISWAMHMGFFSFAMSIAAGLAVISIAARAWPWTSRRRAMIAVLLFIQAVAHAFGAELTALVLLGMVLSATTGERGRVKEIGLLALMGAPMVLIAFTAENQATGATNWLSIVDRLRILPRTFLPGPAWRAWPPLLLALVGVAILVVRWRRKAASHVEIALGGAAALCLAAAFTAPIDLAAWQLFAPRFLPFGCLLGAVLLPLERLDARRRGAALVALFAFAAMSLVWAGRTVSSLRAGEDEALSGLSAPLRRTGPRLVVSVDAFAAQRDAANGEIPYYAPLFNLGPLYALAQGGIPPFSFLSNPKLHPFVLSDRGRDRHPPLFNPADFLDKPVGKNPAARARMLTFLAAIGAPFEDLVVYGRAEDGDLLVDRGYATDFRRGGLFIGHLEGCPATLRITGDVPPSLRVLIEYGAEPLARALRRSVLPEGASREVRLSPSLCGSMWLRATLDRDGSGAPSPGDGYCEGADAEGRLRVTPRDRAGTSILCRLPP